MTSGYYAFTPGTRVRISPEYSDHPGVGTVAPPSWPRGSCVLVRWDDGFISAHDPAELLADE